MTRLVTSVDVDDDDEPQAARMSVSVRHEAELDDGRRVVLLDDRGWSSKSSAHNIWDRTSAEELVRTAQKVVSPAYDYSEEDGCSRDFVEGFHFGMLVGILWQQGVVTSAPQLQEMPHDVELSDRVLARLDQDSRKK